MNSDDGATAAAAAAGGSHHLPLLNLSNVRSRLDHVHHLLSTSLTTNTIIGNPQMELVSMEITSAIHQAIANGTALISIPPPPPLTTSKSDLKNCSNFKPDVELGFPKLGFPELGFPKTEVFNDESGQDWDIVELDAVELLAEHLHFCDFCGKGFKRDANLRMHMRAHGNKFKSLEALSKPPEGSGFGTGSGYGNGSGRGRTRFSCPFGGCGRNRMHKKFRPLKSVICVKNHFKRSHCPKMYSCNRCNKKSFSVLADLKSHLKHCGDTKWRCSCGTSFSRKDKLFGHMALFEGHMPAVPEEDGKAKVVVENGESKGGMDWVDDKGMDDDGFFDGLLDGLGSFGDDFCIPDVFGGGGGSNVGSDWSL